MVNRWPKRYLYRPNYCRLFFPFKQAQKGLAFQERVPYIPHEGKQWNNESKILQLLNNFQAAVIL